MNDKPFSQACENNKDPILQIISTVFCYPTTVWEIGSGTGQHACYFARHLPHVEWQPTDKPENISGINLWLEEAQLVNLKPALTLDVTDTVWPCGTIDALFTANTLHIMSWDEIQIFFDRLAEYLNSKAIVCIYGPFNYNGAFTSDSNARFDQWLKNRNILSGIKNFEDIIILAAAKGLCLINDIAMPANNRLLVLQTNWDIRPVQSPFYQGLKEKIENPDDQEGQRGFQNDQCGIQPRSIFGSINLSYGVDAIL